MKRPILTLAGFGGGLLALGLGSIALPQAQASSVPIKDLTLISETNNMAPQTGPQEYYRYNYRVNVNYRYNVNANVNYRYNVNANVNYRYNVNANVNYRYNYNANVNYRYNYRYRL